MNCSFLYINENVNGLPADTPLQYSPGPSLNLSPQGAGDWTVFLRAETARGPMIVQELHYRWIGRENLILIPGDVDMDGSVTPADARLSLRASVGLVMAEGSYMRDLIMDVDADGGYTSADARLILRAAVGLETLGIEKPPVTRQP